MSSQSLQYFASTFLADPSRAISTHPLFQTLSSTIAGDDAASESQAWWLLVDTCEKLVVRRDLASAPPAGVLVRNLLAIKGAKGLAALNLKPDQV